MIWGNIYALGWPDRLVWLLPGSNFGDFIVRHIVYNRGLHIVAPVDRGFNTLSKKDLIDKENKIQFKIFRRLKIFAPGEPE